MRKIIGKIILVLLLSIMILSMNIQVFADYNDFQKLYLDVTLEQLVSNVNSGKISKKSAADAIKSGKTTDKFISISCYPLFEKNKNFKKYKDTYLDATKKAENQEAFIENSVKRIASGSEATKLKNVVKAYLELEKIEAYVEGITKENETNQKLNDNEEAQNAMIDYSVTQMVDTYVSHGHTIEKIKGLAKGNSILKAWYKAIVTDNKQPDKPGDTVSGDSHTYRDDRYSLRTALINWKDDKDNAEDNPIYQQPGQKNDGKNLSSEKSLEDMVNDADSFVNTGTAQYNQESMQNFSKTIYNIMFTIGIFAAVIVGGVIGIRLMISSASEKAEAKKLLVPYVVGCVVVFGGFGIWKLVVTILQGI